MFIEPWGTGEVHSLSLSRARTHTLYHLLFLFSFQNHIVDEFIVLAQRISVVVSFFFNSLSIV